MTFNAKTNLNLFGRSLGNGAAMGALFSEGVLHAIENKNTNHIVSICILNDAEIDKFLKKIPNKMNLELNISCPNTDEDVVNNNLNKFLNDQRDWCSIKLSPYTDMKLIDK